MYLSSDQDTIAAIATPPGRGGVAVLRISGPNLDVLISGLLSKELQPRHAVLADFLDASGSVIDQGLAIFFLRPTRSLERQC